MSRLRASNLALAEHTKETADAAEAARAEAQVARATLGESLAAYDGVLERARALESSDPRADAIADATRKAADADATSVTSVGDWRDGKVDKTAFLAAFVAHRTEYHKHKALALCGARI